MKIIRYIYLYLILLLIPLYVFGENVSENLIGVWISDDNNSHIQIFRCEKKYCARLIWLKNSSNQNGEALKDYKNPDKNLRTENVVGLKVFWNFEYQGNGKYKNGKMYNYKDGRTYHGELTLKENKLKVRGYVFGIRWLGGSTVMTRKK